MRYKCHCQYDGSHFCGWQRQPRVATVQGTIEDALKAIYLEPVTVHGASRTDKGVHALEQVFHFDGPKDIPLEKLQAVINRQLPSSIHVSHIATSDPDFHSRYSCVGKEYRYYLETDSTPNVFRSSYVYHYGRLPNLAAMEYLAKHFIGTHDFKAFMASGSDKEVTVRTLYHIGFEWDGTTVVMAISGNGFLYNMVRIMMGMFLDYSEGKLSETTILNSFVAGERQAFRRTAPAEGLYLARTYYEENKSEG